MVAKQVRRSNKKRGGRTSLEGTRRWPCRPVNPIEWAAVGRRANSSRGTTASQDRVLAESCAAANAFSGSHQEFIWIAQAKADWKKNGRQLAEEGGNFRRGYCHPLPLYQNGRDFPDGQSRPPSLSASIHPVMRPEPSPPLTRRSLSSLQLRSARLPRPLP